MKIINKNNARFRTQFTKPILLCLVTQTQTREKTLMKKNNHLELGEIKQGFIETLLLINILDY